MPIQVYAQRGIQRHPDTHRPYLVFAVGCQKVIKVRLKPYAVFVIVIANATVEQMYDVHVLLCAACSFSGMAGKYTPVWHRLTCAFRPPAAFL